MLLLEQRDYDKAEEMIVYNVPEVNSTASTANLDQVHSILKVSSTIRQNKRLGPVSPDSNVRPRPLEIVLSSAFDRRTLMSNAVAGRNWCYLEEEALLEGSSERKRLA